MSIYGKTRRRRRETGLLDDVVRCSKCDQPNRRASGQRYCASCHAEYMKGWRSKRVTVLRETMPRETQCSTQGDNA